MKKLLIQILFLMLVITAMAQSVVYISGTITDIANGNPLINHNVYIFDSASGYYYMAHSDSSGFYSGSIPIPSGSSGLLYVSTYDCNTQLQQEGLNYDPLNLSLTQDFQICSSNAPCQANFYYDKFANRVFHFFDTSTGNPTSWNWTFGDGGSSTVQNPEHWYNSNGWFSVTLTISTSTGCTSNITINVYADASYGGGCSAAFTVIPDTSNAPPYTYSFIDQSTGNIISRMWDFGDPSSGTNNTSNLQNPTHTFMFAGNYKVCLTIQGADSTCYDITCDTIIVGSNPGCISNFTYSGSPNTSSPTLFADQSQSAGGGPISLWYWVFDDPASGTNNTSTVQNPTHLFATPGYHNVCLTIDGTDSTCYDQLCKTVYVESLPPIRVNITGTVTNTTTGNPAPNHAVTWGIWADTTAGPRTVYTNSDGVYSDSVLLPQGMIYGTAYVWTQYCQYIVELSFGFGPNNYSLHQDLNLGCDDNQPCQANMKVSAAGKLTVQFDDISIGDVASRVWNFGDGDTSTDKNPVHTYSSQQDYNMTLSIANDSTGCSSIAYKTIHFADSLLCNADFDFSTTAEPRTVQFEDQSSGADGLRFWSFGDGDTSTQDNPVHTYRYAGLYLAFLTIGNYNTPCWQTKAKAILITDSIVECQAHFTYTPIPPVTAYLLQFTDQSTGNPVNWLWYFGDNTYSTEQNPVHVYPGPGVYLACLTISGNNCTSTFCLNVFVEDSVVYHQIYGQVFEGNFPLQMGVALIISVDSTANYSPFVDVCNIDSNGVYYFTMVPDGNYLVYAIPIDSNGYLSTYFGNVLNWEVATIIPLGEPNNPYKIYLIPAGNMPVGPGSIGGQVNVVNIKSSMLDKMTMLLQDEAGKTISFDRVSESGSFTFPTLAYGTYYLHAEMAGITSDYVKVILSAVKPYADVVMTFTGKNILGINDIHAELEAGVIYPNPSTDKFNLELNLTEAVTVKVEIFNQTGQVISSMIKSLGSGQTILTLSTVQMATGFYTLRISTDKGINLTRKLMITR